MNTATEGSLDFQRLWEEHVKQPWQFYPSEYKPSRRDYFAKAALQGLLANSNYKIVFNPEEVLSTCAKDAVIAADRTIAALNETDSAAGKSATVNLTKEHLWNSESGEIGRPHIIRGMVHVKEGETIEEVMKKRKQYLPETEQEYKDAVNEELREGPNRPR